MIDGPINIRLNFAVRKVSDNKGWTYVEVVKGRGWRQAFTEPFNLRRNIIIMWFKDCLRRSNVDVMKRKYYSFITNQHQA